MLAPLIRRSRSKAEPRSTDLRSTDLRSNERGFTMALVALSLVSIIGMAALSIDIGTLYQAKAEAQRAADAAALTAARMISLSGITGDPTTGSSDGSWADTCGGSTSPASAAAVKVAQQNSIGGGAVPAGSVTVTYGAGKNGGAAADCSTLGAAFGINPTVTVTVQRTNLPLFFARAFSLFGSTYTGSTVSATASAEAFNSSNSSSVAGTMIPVQPRCVKPWIVPNIDPGNNPNPLVSLVDGSIGNPGVQKLGPGVIGETFLLNADCASPGVPGTCARINPQPTYTPATNVLQYIPALVQGNPGAVPSCSPTTGFQAAIAGCDQTTVYACGTANTAQYDLTENPVNINGATGDTGTAISCLTQSAPTYNGADTLLPSYPFQMEAGLGNPLVQNGVVFNNDIITTSNSIVTIPIYQNGTAATPLPAQVTIVGFMQVFINGLSGVAGNPGAGNINVTVLNVTGCSNIAGGNPTVAGTSPVPVRLITPP